MRKSLLAIWIVLMMLLPSFAQTDGAGAKLQDLYEQAELAMVSGDYEGAAAQFDALGTYSDASQMAMYCKALSAAETLGLFEISIDTFDKLGDFKDSRQMKVYYQVRVLLSLHVSYTSFPGQISLNRLQYKKRVFVTGTFEDVDVNGFHDGLAGVKIGGKWGFIDRTGNLAIAAQYDAIHSFVHGIAFVRQGEKWKIIDTGGNTVW